MKKAFDTLLKSEIKKAEAAANKYLNRKDCKVTGYSAKSIPPTGCGTWYEARCEICYNYEERAEVDVILHIFMDDRRRSWARVAAF